MAAYVIVDVEVIDPAKFREYGNQVPATVEEYGGKYLVRGGAFEKSPLAVHRRTQAFVLKRLNNKSKEGRDWTSRNRSLSSRTSHLRLKRQCSTSLLPWTNAAMPKPNVAKR